MGKSHSEYLHRQNVANYTRMLRDAPDGQRRKILMTLLAEESAAAKVNGWLPLQG